MEQTAYALFDTHTHLLDEAFDPDREEVIASFPAAGIAGCMEACTCEKDMEPILALTRRYSFYYGSAGVHPHSAGEWNDGAEVRMRRLLQEPKMLAIGEIGLDYHYDFYPREVQREAFAAQLSLAKELRLPVIIHDREAHGDTMDLLRPLRGSLTGIMHCFSGSYETAKECLEDGLYVAFGGALTFKNAANRREIAAKLPLDRLLLETDCPYMTPVPRRGERNDPRLMRLTFEVLCGIRPESPEEIAAATVQNAKAVFGIG